MFRTYVTALMASTVVTGYNWTLPGDAGWPTVGEWNELRATIEGNMDIRGEATYYCLSANSIAGYSQSAVDILPATEGDVVRGLEFAMRKNIRVCVVGQFKHPDARGMVDNCLAMGLLNMNKITVDTSAPSVTFQSGATWDQIRAAVAKADTSYYVNSDFLKGSSPYGWGSAGGFGPLSRMVGYGADDMVAARVVLPNGTVTTCSDAVNPDLMWALRGGAGSAWGIVVEMTLKLHVMENLQGLGLVGTYHTTGNETAVFSALDALSATLPDYVTVTYTLLNDLPGPSMYGQIYCMNTDPANNCQQHIEGFQKALPECIPNTGQCAPVLLKSFHDFWAAKPQFPTQDTGFLTSYMFGRDKFEAASKVAAGFLQETTTEKYQAGAGCTVWLVGGAAKNIDPDSTATSISPELRSADYVMVCWFAVAPCGKFQHSLKALLHFEGFDNEMHAITPTMYWGMPNHRPNTGSVYGPRYWGSNYNRLLQVKRQYDPSNHLTCFQCVGYEMPSENDPAICPFCVCSCTNNPGGKCSDTSPLVTSG